jgi:outer membrane protein
MRTRQIALALAALGASATVHAQQNIVDIGIVNIQPNSSAGDISGPFVPTGVSLDVKNATTAFFSYTRTITDNWSVELALGFPPTHDVTAKIEDTPALSSVQNLNGQTIAHVRQVAPTVFANYTFGSAQSAFRPFVGLGVNYTTFDKADSTEAGDALSGGPTQLHLSDSIGTAFQVGGHYRLNDQWTLTGGVSTAHVTTTLTSVTSGVTRTCNITFHPIVAQLSAGYHF